MSISHKERENAARYILRKCMLYFYYLSLSSLETYICTERQVVQNLKIALKLGEKIKKFKFWNLVMFISIP